MKICVIYFLFAFNYNKRKDNLREGGGGGG